VADLDPVGVAGVVVACDRLLVTVQLRGDGERALVVERALWPWLVAASDLGRVTGLTLRVWLVGCAFGDERPNRQSVSGGGRVPRCFGVCQGRFPWPPGRVAHLEDERGGEHAADQQRVDEHAGRHGRADLADRYRRELGESRERPGQDDTCGGDDADAGRELGCWFDLELRRGHDRRSCA